jgi:hypothetical protein
MDNPMNVQQTPKMFNKHERIFLMERIMFLDSAHSLSLSASNLLILTKTQVISRCTAEIAKVFFDHKNNLFKKY